MDLAAVGLGGPAGRAYGGRQALVTSIVSCPSYAVEHPESLARALQSCGGVRMARRKSHYARPPKRQAYTGARDSGDRADGSLALKTWAAWTHSGSPGCLNGSQDQ